jgi:hypothetical protein
MNVVKITAKDGKRGQKSAVAYVAESDIAAADKILKSENPGTEYVYGEPFVVYTDMPTFQARRVEEANKSVAKAALMARLSDEDRALLGLPLNPKPATSPVVVPVPTNTVVATPVVKPTFSPAEITMLGLDDTQLGTNHESEQEHDYIPDTVSAE